MKPIKVKPLRVLVVDDDKQICKTFKRGLESKNRLTGSAELKTLGDSLFNNTPAEKSSARQFEVSSCSQGADAVALVRNELKAGRHFDAITLDIRMPPGISGIQTGCQIRDVDSDVPIIFISGFANSCAADISREVPPPGLVHYVNKPVRVAKLAHVINQASNINGKAR